MFNVAKPKIKELMRKADNSYGKYEIEPLERGYGITLGNVLRRTLLSSLPGTAISQIKIDGILHEFMPVKGMKEDVTEFIANLKKVNIRNTNKSDEKKYGYLNVKGKKVVTAGDIQVGGSLSIVNPDFVIAHLGTDKAELNVDFVITDGYGYQPAIRDSEHIDHIAIDSIYSPVLNVIPKVTNARVGQSTDYDKLTLEIFTDGTINPKDAISMAGQIIIDQMQIFASYAEEEDITPFIANKEKESIDLSLMMIEELDLNLRTYNALKNASIESVGDLVSLSVEGLLKVKNLGEKSLEEITTKLQEFDLELTKKEGN